MKRTKWILALVLALGASFALCACGPDDAGNNQGGTTPPGSEVITPGGNEQGGNEQGGNEQGGNEQGGNEQGGNEPAEVKPSELGAFSRVWLSEEGDVLDLTTCTMTSDLYTDFKLTGVSGENAEMEIAAKSDGLDYVLSLNDNGALELKLKGSSVATSTFYAEAKEFAGAWKSSDTYSMVYYKISSEIAAGGFVWNEVNRYSDEVFTSAFGVTKLVFTEDGASVTFLAKTTYYDAFEISCQDGKLVYYDLGYEEEYDFLPYLGGFNEELSYLDEEGNSVSFGEEDNEILYNGTTYSFSLTNTALGSGLKFIADGTEYLFQAQPAGVCLVSEKNASLLAAYDDQVLLGEWSDSTGDNTFVVTTPGQVTFNGNSYTLKAYAKEGEILYDFTVSGETYTLKLVEEVVFELTQNGSLDDYYILDEAKELFIGTFTDHSETFTVHNDYSVTFSEGNAQSGSFTYIEELEVITFTFKMMMNDGNSQRLHDAYLINVDPDGAYWVLDDYGEIYGSFFTAEYETAFRQVLSSYLNGENDVYTTGGKTPVTISFDFAEGKIVYGGKEYTNYYYNYAIDDFGNGYPSIQFSDDPISDEDAGTVTMTVYTVQLSGHGVQVSAVGITATVTGNNISYDFGDEVIQTFISKATFESLLGKAFVYRGQHFDETITIGLDGSLSVDTTDRTNSPNAVVAVEYDYYLQVYLNTNQEELIALIFNGVYVNVWEGGKYATITEIVYGAAEYVDFVGTYHLNGNVVEFNGKGEILVNGTAVALKNAFTVTGTTLTAVYEKTAGTDCTLAFTKDGGLTVTETETENYAKFHYTPYAFVGTYAIGGKTVKVTSRATGLNTKPELKVTLDNTPVTATLSLDENGKQQLSFSYLVVFPDFVMTNYTLTLDGNKITVSDGTNSAEADAAAWSYSDFIFENDVTLDGKTLKCYAKEEGTLPFYLFDDVASSIFEVSADEEGNIVMSVQFGTSDVVIITLPAGGGDVQVSLPGIPEPPAPPAPPLP